MRYIVILKHSVWQYNEGIHMTKMFVGNENKQD